MSIIRILVSAILITTLALSSSACSFLFVKGPPPQHQSMDYFHCSESSAWPVLDLIWAGLNGIGAASAVSADETELEDRDQVIGVGLAWLAISGAASIYGFTKTSECRKAKEEEARRRGGQRGIQPVVPIPAPSH